MLTVLSEAEALSRVEGLSEIEGLTTWFDRLTILSRVEGLSKVEGLCGHDDSGITVRVRSWDTIQ
jgi:hypothetical protein